MEALERYALVRSLWDNGGHTQEAARTLGMSRLTVYRKMNGYSVTQHPYSLAKKYWLTTIMRSAVPWPFGSARSAYQAVNVVRISNPLRQPNGRLTAWRFAPSAWAISGARSWSTTRMSLRKQQTLTRRQVWCGCS
jgi:hypothetical protein